MISSETTTFVMVVLLSLLFKTCDAWPITEEHWTTDERENTLNATSFLDSPQLLDVITADGTIHGITVKDNLLFVLGVGSTQQVNVYKTDTLQFTRRMTISNYYDMRAIVANPQYNCLYFSDILQNAVVRYDLAKRTFSHWNVGGDSYGLSLTTSHNLLVTLFYPIEPYEDDKLIKEYTQNGSLVREICLGSEIEHPRHSVQMSTGQLVVVHSDSESLHRVCLVNSRGQITQCYGGPPGSGIGQLNLPTNLAVDRHDNVLVSDHDNNRIVLLSPKLEHLGYIAVPGHTLPFPYALHLDQLNNRLYIGVKDGRIFVLGSK